jgi:carboxyl-terminal processing protease
MDTFVKALGFGGASAALVLFALAGCSGQSNSHLNAGDEAHLFEEAYSDITRFYIEPVEPASLAMAGLGGLTKIDSALSVDQAGDQVVLHDSYGATSFAKPGIHDAGGWANVTHAVLSAARTRSPAVAALSAEQADEAILDATTSSMLDRFSRYSAPDAARERRAARDGFGGIGVTLDPEGVELRITQVFPGSPAASAGLRVGDQIVAIDGVDATTLNREEVVHLLRGPLDSTVALSVVRASVADRLAFSVLRGHIVPPSVTLEEKDGVARLRLATFNQQTGQSVADLLGQAHQDMGSALHGIILDLRGNPGGLLDQSVEVASLFLDGGPVTSTAGRAPESVQYFTAPRRDVERLPLVVLVNGGSASASEIVAAALQDTGRAVIIGSASYGKGTVQNVQFMPNDGELTITWARLITPGGYILHQHGVVPTICTANLSDSASAVGSALRDDSSAGLELRRPRAALDDAGWKHLRELCPGQHEDHEIEVRTARRVLADPALYARELGTPPAAAGRPIASIGLSH